MSRLRLGISISLDGYVAGPDQSTKEPLGVGGEHLHDWVVPLAAWREAHGLEGGEVNESTPMMEQALVNVGATIMGRNMFGGGPGPWNREKPWNGWWGKKPPFHHPVFVLTHHPRAPLSLDDTTFHFVTGGAQEALDRARDAADGKDVWLAGGAQACQQYLRAGQVDEMTLHVVPLLLGGGARLFDNVGPDLHGLRPVRTVATARVTHLQLARP